MVATAWVLISAWLLVKVLTADVSPQVLPALTVLGLTNEAVSPVTCRAAHARAADIAALSAALALALPA